MCQWEICKKLTAKNKKLIKKRKMKTLTSTQFYELFWELAEYMVIANIFMKQQSRNVNR